MKREMLAAIRGHLAASAPHDAVREEHHARHGAHGRPEPPNFTEPTGSPVELFREALEAVAGRCSVVKGETEAAEVLRGLIEESGARRVAVSDSPLARRVAGLLKTEASVSEADGAAELFECDLGVTGAQWAVAETGTLVLESDRERHRLASLVPSAHVALVEAGRVRHTLGEVLAALNEQGADGLSRAVTFITGPSRTSDIELTLAIGVHGPKALHVIIIES